MTIRTVVDLDCCWCKTNGHKAPHFWRYKSKLIMHCEKCCEKTLRFAIKLRADYSPINHYFYVPGKEKTIRWISHSYFSKMSPRFNRSLKGHDEAS